MINSKELAEFILTAAKEMYIDNPGTKIREWIISKGLDPFQADILTILLSPQLAKTSILSARMFIDPDFSERLSEKSKNFVSFLDKNMDKILSMAMKNFEYVDTAKRELDRLQFEADVLGTEEGLKKYTDYAETFCAMVQKEGGLLN